MTTTPHPEFMKAVGRLIDGVNDGEWGDLHALAEEADRQRELILAEPPQIIVMLVDEWTTDDDGDEWNEGDLVLVCPDCEDVNHLIERDRATCEHDLDIEEGWISVADPDHADFHDLDFLCGGCRATVTLPVADETRVVWG